MHEEVNNTSLELSSALRRTYRAIEVQGAIWHPDCCVINNATKRGGVRDGERSIIISGGRMTKYALRINNFENRYKAYCALCEIHSTFPDKPLNQVTIYRWLRKLEGRVSDAPSDVS